MHVDTKGESSILRWKGRIPHISDAELLACIFGFQLVGDVLIHIKLFGLPRQCLSCHRHGTIVTANPLSFTLSCSVIHAQLVRLVVLRTEQDPQGYFLEPLKNIRIQLNQS